MRINRFIRKHTFGFSANCFSLLSVCTSVATCKQLYSVALHFLSICHNLFLPVTAVISESRLYTNFRRIFNSGFLGFFHNGIFPNADWDFCHLLMLDCIALDDLRFAIVNNIIERRVLMNGNLSLSVFSLFKCQMKLCALAEFISKTLSAISKASITNKRFIVCYFFQASMIPLKSAAFKEAPPIRPPSMSGFAKSSGALLALQLPPYRMLVSSATSLPYFSAITLRM